MGLIGEHLEECKKMLGFFDDFKYKISKAVKRLRFDLEAMKSNVSEWVKFLDKNQIEMQEKIMAMEKRLEELEQKQKKRIQLMSY